MSRKSLGMAVALAAAVLVAGCKNADEEEAPAFVPKTYAFEGKLEPTYVGSWNSVDGTSMLDIGKDGSLNIDTTTRSVAGKNTSHVVGKWLASGSTLMFQYTVGTQPTTVLKYTASLSGKSLTLQQADSRVKVKYNRK